MKELRNEENEEIHLTYFTLFYNAVHWPTFILSLIINFANELILLSPLKIFLFSFGSFIGIPFLCPEILIL